MNTKRRSLGAALDMSDEKMAFIEGGIPAVIPSIASLDQQKQMEPVVELRESQEIKVESPQSAPTREQHGETITDAQPQLTPQTPRRNRGRNSRRDQANAEEGMPGMANLLIPLTTRLSPATATALKRAGLEQKLYGRKPGTVQEIAEEAITCWLREQDYL